MVYFIVFICLLAGIYAFDYKKISKGSLVAWCVLCAAFILIAGLRYRLGGDSIIYEDIYKKMPTLSQLEIFKFNNSRYQPGYVIFTAIPRSLSPDFTYMQIFHAIVVNVVVFWFIFNNTANRYIALTFYFTGLYLNMNMEILREALAVCCFLLAWPAFRDGKWLLYYLLVFLACSFHISALVCLIFPLTAIPGIRFLFRLGWQCLALCLVIFAICYTLQRQLIVMLGSITDNASILEKVQNYSKSNTYGNLNLNIFGMLEQIIKNILIPAAALWYMKKVARGAGDARLTRWVNRIELLIVTGIYFAVMTLIIPISSRFNNYVALFNFVTVASCFFTPLCLRKRKFRLPGYAWTSVFLVVLFFNVKLYFAASVVAKDHKFYSVYYPYYSRLDMKTDQKREEIFRSYSHIK